MSKIFDYLRKKGVNSQGDAKKMPEFFVDNRKILFKEASVEDIVWWMSNVSPKLDQKSRLDWNWDWVNIYWLLRSIGTFRSPKILAVQAENDDGVVTLGLCAALTKEVYVLNDSSYSTFLWFLAAAPKEIVNEYCGNLVGKLSIGAHLIEYAVRYSFIMGHGGRNWLHAASDELKPYYSKQCFMHNTDKKINIPKIFRKNDGLYFHHCPAKALYFLKRQEEKR